jgi:Zn-dependent protease with chaperone function
MRKLLVITALGLLSTPALAQSVTKQPQPGFNLFSVSQDIEIGKQSAVEAERQLPLLRNSGVDSYLNRIIQRLAAGAPGAKYPYQIKAVNAPEINAFALPGGPMYVNRGLIEAARSEAELAGVLAHEMSHVALRHGTHQASKSYLTRSGLGILGGLLGKPTGGTAQVLNTVGGVGLNALFLKFSRNDEYEADQVGQQIMAKAGYDPLAMATLFELLRAEQDRNPSKVEQFFSSHPSSANREARLREYAKSLGSGRTEVVGNFTSIRTGLRRLPLTSSQQVVTQTVPPAQDTPVTGQVAVQVAAPSSRFLRFEHPSGFFSIDHPDNWNVYPSGLAVSMAPEGGVVNSSDGRQILLYGVIVNHYTPFAGEEERRSLSLERSYAPFEDRTKPRGALEDATDDLIRTILSANSYLRAEAGSARSEVIDAAPGFSVLLTGLSPLTGEEERVQLYTRSLPDGHVIYALVTAPARSYDEVAQTFGRMIRTLAVSDAAAHRVSGANGNPLR